MIRTNIIAECFFFAATAVMAQESDKAIEAKQVNPQTIQVDGVLDEALWQQSPLGSKFVQVAPHKGKPASFRTEIRVVYDHEYLYIGVLCHDPRPEELVARITKREGLIESDDAIAIMLDTFSDGRSAYGFFTNILGTQKDGRVSYNGRVWDATWDGVWKSAGSRTNLGWTAELAIHLPGLKFEPGNGRVWGLGVARFIPRMLEIDTWTGPLETFAQVSQFGKLTNLNLSATKKVVQVIPHVISRVEENSEPSLEGGVDARFVFSQSVSGNLTLNPDFATIEADEEVVNLTRFETFLPEKRNFSLKAQRSTNNRFGCFTLAASPTSMPA